MPAELPSTPSSRRIWLRRLVAAAVLLALAIAWANVRILVLRRHQDPANPLVPTGYYIFHAMAAALETGRVGQLELVRYREYVAAGNPLAPYRPNARRGAAPEYIHYYSHDVGYSFLVELARLAFPSLPDNYYRALALQLLADAVTIVFLYFVFAEWSGCLGLAAAALFAGNRVFVQLVSFAYYYYWDVTVATLLLGLLVLAARRPRQAGAWLGVAGVVLGFGVWLRATWWPLGLVYLAAVAAWRPVRGKLPFLVLPLALLGAPQIWRASTAHGHLALTTRASWHVALVGLGYYPNPFGLEAKDEAVFQLTKDRYGVPFRFEDYGGQHDVAAKLEYMRILKSDPRFVVGSFLGRLKESMLGTTRDSLAPYPLLGNLGYRALCVIGLLLMVRQGGERRLLALVAAALYVGYVGLTSLFYFVGLSYDSVSQVALLMLAIGFVDAAVGASVRALDRLRTPKLATEPLAKD